VIPLTFFKNPAGTSCQKFCYTQSYIPFYKTSVCLVMVNLYIQPTIYFSYTVFHNYHYI